VRFPGAFQRGGEIHRPQRSYSTGIEHECCDPNATVDRNAPSECNGAISLAVADLSHSIYFYSMVSDHRRPILGFR